MLAGEDFTVGVEEEYQIIHPDTRELRSHGKRIVSKARETVGDEVTPELYLSQIEIGTPICRSLSDVRAELTRLRREVIGAAEQEGSRIAAAGTHPFSHWEDQTLTPKDRYLDLAADYRQLAREQLIFGCHVHVGINDREMAIQVMNRSRLWLAPLLALAANSPFWLGVDTGYASFRTAIWRRWPMTGTPLIFAARADYDRLVADLVATESISDATMIYWDVRPSARFETLEFRVTDVCMTVGEAVMVAGLSRALARTCAAEASRGKEFHDIRPEILRAAKWRAARSGLEEELVDVRAARAVPARELVEMFLGYLRPSLEEYDEWDEVVAQVHEVLDRGTGAARQRAEYSRNASFQEVVDFIVAETIKGTA
jgi:carboxylate-amine ligase